MQTRVIITCLVGAMALYAERCHGGTTLYPIIDSNTPIPQVSAVQRESGHTNRVPAGLGISLTLKPTAIGPPGATGLVQINDRTALLHVSGLGAGRYDLQLVRRPDGVIEPLGTLTIVDPTLGPSRQANDNKKEASANP